MMWSFTCTKVFSCTQNNTESDSNKKAKAERGSFRGPAAGKGSSTATSSTTVDFQAAVRTMP
eukprot:2018585-Rhodomonas_salina.1